MTKIQPMTGAGSDQVTEYVQGGNFNYNKPIGLSVATWNVSSINNNPFEYWVRHPDPAYDSLMQGIQSMIEDRDQDIPIQQIFTDAMFSELICELNSCGIEGIHMLEKFWLDEYRERTAIKGFLKDKNIGVKRLTSMPDRITNTIHLNNGGICYRPAVINAYDGSPLQTGSQWWALWKEFIFHTKVQVCCESEEQIAPQLVVQLIPPILRSKYPAISLEEQAASIPLQILCLAIMDAILLHMLNTVAPGTWQRLRKTLADALILNKQARLCQVLESHDDVEVFFIQEASAAFCKEIGTHPRLADRYSALLPASFDSRRNQNSLVLAARSRFPSAGEDVTEQVRHRNADRK